MRTLAATALTTLALTSLVACGNDSKTAADLGCGDGPQIKITETGSKPLEKLELAPQEGESIELDTTMDMTVSVRADGSTVPTDSIPSMTLGMTATVESVTDDEIGMSFEYDKVSVEGDDQVESELEGLVGTTGTITTDTNGAYVDGTIEPAPGMDTQMEGVLEQFEQQLANLTVPLPDEAVGQGATWEVTTPVELNGLEACNSYTYELTERNGTEYELDVDIDQEMAPGPVDQDGVEAKLIEGSTQGSGTTQGNLSMPLTVTGTNEVESSTSMEVEQGDETQDLESDIGMSMTVEQRKASAKSES